MNKNKSARTAIIILLALVFIAGFFLLNRKSNNSTEGMILFYSLSCPHCQNVEKYIQENNIKSKYSFTQLEISANKQNNEKLITKAKACGLDPQGLGVPFLWTGDKCLMGDTDIIDFFKK